MLLKSLLCILLANALFVRADPTCGQQKVTSTDANAVVGEFPWLAILRYKKIGEESTKNLCAGTLIHPRFVITAATCANPKEFVLSEIVLGKHDLTATSEKEQVFGIEKKVIHSGYKIRELHDDIALIKLDKEVVFSDTVQPICLPTSNVLAPVNATVYSSGWGKTKNAALATIKKKVSSIVISHEECVEAYKSHAKITENIFCTKQTSEEVTCQGDSGGPIMYFVDNHWRVDGIVSFGSVCGGEMIPDGNTKVGPYLDWIQESML